MGSFCKGGVESQRTGGVKTQIGFFDKSKLEKVALTRGYYNLRAIADGLVPVFELSSKKIQNKLNSGRLTKEECEVIGAFFEMTMKEYYDVVMFGLFQEDREGHYRCKVDDIYRHLHPQPSVVSPVERSRIMRERLAEEIQELEYEEE